MKKLLIMLCAVLGGCGLLDESMTEDPLCLGKCEGPYINFQKNQLYQVISEIVYPQAAPEETCDGCENSPLIETVKGSITHGLEGKYHVYMIDAPYGMHLTLDVKVKGYNKAKIYLIGPANENGVWNINDIKDLVLPRRKNTEDPEIMSGTLGDISLRPFGQHALVIGPADEHDLWEEDSLSWTYEIKVGCNEYCRSVAPEGLTRYPIYYAHGFAASRETWTDLFAKQINPSHPAWRLWANFGSVPPYQPITQRIDQLRQNLSTYLNDLTRESSKPGSPIQLPPGETHWKLNLVAHSMGGLDSRYLAGNPLYNEQCDDRSCLGPDGNHNVYCCQDSHNQPISCCAPGPGGMQLPWREVIASITTLSTPHQGSEFADWGLAELNKPKGKFYQWVIEQVLSLFGDEANDLDKAIQTFENLSTKVVRQLSAEVADPLTTRYYSWACATDQQTCTGTLPDIAIEDAPQLDLQRCPNASQQGSNSAECYKLPGPQPGLPTIFSWAGETCFTGMFGWGCGDLPAASIAPAYLIMRSYGPNDGVVSVESAKYGIFMGVKPRDHFEWSSADDKYASFHLFWINELKRAGY